VLYLQHGLLDSSLGWVSSGVVGSQAFAAYDQGYDVFLGNFRGLASREHVNKHISAQRCAVQFNFSVVTSSLAVYSFCCWCSIGV
jgi:hypothetical protein